MAEKLKDYQVIEVEDGGNYYKVRHKITNDIFTWWAHDCSYYTNEQIQNIINEVKILIAIKDDNLIKYYDTILHSQSKTLYFVLEQHSMYNLQTLLLESKNCGKNIKEKYIWYILHELAKACKQVYDKKFSVFRKLISTRSIYVDENTGTIRINCFEISTDSCDKWNVLPEIGKIIYSLCYLNEEIDLEQNNFGYSDDLKSVLWFMLDQRNANLKPNVLLFHPTVLGNVDNTKISDWDDIFVATVFDSKNLTDRSDGELNKAMDINSIECELTLNDSHIYINISPKKVVCVTRNSNISATQSNVSMSPTLAALALELPGYKPRKPPRRDLVEKFKDPQQVTEETFSKQWMSRLVALREREESLNRRERDLIAKEIQNSPCVTISSMPSDDFQPIFDEEDNCNINNFKSGITLPSVMNHKPIESSDNLIVATNSEMGLVPKRYHRRSSSVKLRNKRRKSYYEDFNSSLSAGEDSVIITTTRFANDNIPVRNIFLNASNKKVHFTENNPFAESNNGVTLKFYELENVDDGGYQVPRQEEYTNKVFADEISKFKYLDLEKITSQKRTVMQSWDKSSPNKQPLFSRQEKNLEEINNDPKVFSDITNRYNTRSNALKKVHSKSSLSSKVSNSTRYSTSSAASNCSSGSDKSKASFRSIVSMSKNLGQKQITESKENIKTHTEQVVPVTEKKSKGRMSFISFKAPFKLR